MSATPEKILVTGGAGFIGSHLCEALLADGAELVVIDDFNDYYNPAIKRGNIAGFRDRITMVEGDIRDVALVDSVFASHKFDKVFHLAARAGVRPSIADPRLYVSTNIDSTLNLLEGCRATGVKHFVFASSSSVYGPRQRPDLAISKFTRLILDDQPIDQYGDGSAARDCTYVEDIIRGVMAAGRYTAHRLRFRNRQSRRISREHAGPADLRHRGDHRKKSQDQLAPGPARRRAAHLCRCLKILPPLRLRARNAAAERAGALCGVGEKTTLRKGSQ